MQNQQTPMISVAIDQEVFMDSVREGDRVEDATVATEVISFDRVEDTYVLEGAIVFAGYLASQEKGKSSEGKNTQIVMDDDPVIHVHHRLPFILKVPVHAQPNGVLNVKSRLAGWKLDVSGDSWLRVQGNLQIAGLVDKGGYHFQCGAQEIGDLWVSLPDRPQSTHVNELSSQGMKETNAWVGEFRGETEASESESLMSDTVSNVESDTFAEQSFNAQDQGQDTPFPVRGMEDPEEEGDSAERLNRVTLETEQLSEARAGHGLQIQEDVNESKESRGNKENQTPSDINSSADSTVLGAAAELEALDRFVVSDTEEQKPLAEYSFENQLSEKQEAQFEEKEAISFSASRAFSDSGFHANLAFSKDAGRIQQTRTEPVVEPSPSNGAFQEPETSFERSMDNKSLWSFVDFNAPERFYTLRYVVVEEGETLQMVADRVGVLKSEMIRVNRLETEDIWVGQTLLIPDTPIRLANVQNF
ncbi:LysM peptidoglycan-binding domain-containing protein [Alicyclobacillus sp. TC]|uniref:LysM peptidoglycan-binding domain-containing protein n=1 Tax=Alicyclobacillus sp. TC TaxID=2606450 RepID=UPI0019335FD1|nr:LysM peptidoglycan-binding domain-containing protein [Alicyclobacillus sp. TC]QRF23201.1 LysM peptidoglycan-binding domain-containing protein [Alicyclobacillus sp. TC]